VTFFGLTRSTFTAGEVLQQVRSEFERYKQPPDLYAIKYHLSDGRERLKQLGDMIGLSR
jgi:hypothetical protein